MRLTKALASSRVGTGVVSGVVVSVFNKTWLTPPLPQRQAVELSGGTHHRVDAGSVSWSFQTTQDDEALRPDGGQSDRRRDRTDRDLNMLKAKA